MTDPAQHATLTAATLTPAVQPTFYFIGVSTAHSSIRQVFPEWARELNLGPVDFVGIDLPLHAPAADYRRVVQFLRDDPESLGALVTTHKLDLFQAASDLFGYADPLAQLMGEASSISRRGGQLRAHAKDPITAGFAINAILAPNKRSDRSVFIMGAGGSATAIVWHLTRGGRGEGAPAEIVVSDRDPERLRALETAYAKFDARVPLRLELTPDPPDNDGVLAGMAPGSVIVNATGLGKDAPGSPLSDAGVFPERAVVWELNYRGELDFLEQARAQEDARQLSIHDGWVYFLHGWTRVIAEVFNVEIPTDGPGFEALSDIARSARGA